MSLVFRPAAFAAADTGEMIQLEDIKITSFEEFGSGVIFHFREDGGLYVTVFNSEDIQSEIEHCYNTHDDEMTKFLKSKRKEVFPY